MYFSLIENFKEFLEFKTKQTISPITTQPNKNPLNNITNSTNKSSKESRINTQCNLELNNSQNECSVSAVKNKAIILNFKITNTSDKSLPSSLNMRIKNDNNQREIYEQFCCGLKSKEGNGGIENVGMFEVKIIPKDLGITYPGTHHLRLALTDQNKSLISSEISFVFTVKFKDTNLLNFIEKKYK